MIDGAVVKDKNVGAELVSAQWVGLEYDRAETSCGPRQARPLRVIFKRPLPVYCQWLFQYN